MDAKFWDDVYSTKLEKTVSWFQDVPTQSLKLIAELNLQPDDRIIDIGGGDSRLVDHLLDQGFNNISVLDISSTALDKAKTRLATRAARVHFITSDITKFEPVGTYHLWHDRATFHFLTNAQDVAKYLETASRALTPNGYLIVSTFSKTGPEKCSGLAISQYSDMELKTLFAIYFDNIKCLESTHKTPWGSAQNFVYCGFKKRNS